MAQPAHQSAQSPIKTKTGQLHYRVAEPDLPAQSFQGRLIADPSELESLRPSWERLIETAVRENLFFDPDFLIPAVRHLNHSEVSVLVVEAPPRVNPRGKPVLCGLFPLNRNRVYGLPFRGLEVWKHDLCFDCTPLIRQDCGAEVIDFIGSYLADTLNIKLFSVNCLAADGRFAQLITEDIFRNRRTVFRRDEFTRACFRPLSDGGTYIRTKVAKNTRKGTQRLRRILERQGTVRTQHLYKYDSNWIEQFLTLESAGWKGKNKTSLASNENTRRFFEEMSAGMLDKGKMVISKTTFDDRPIAMLCDLQSNGRGAHFKIAIDENWSEFSPGLFVELDNIERLHRDGVSCVDSCADPDHSMINRVWPDRLRYQNLVIACGGPISKLAVAAMPLLQQVNRFIHPRRRFLPPAKQQATPVTPEVNP